MEIKSLLIKYLKNEITKQQLKEIVIAQNIKTEFNNYIFSLLRCTKQKISNKSLSISTNMMLDTAFLQEIKETPNQTANWKPPKDELYKKLKLEPKLNSYFILKRNEHVNMRMKRISLEYGIDMNIDAQKIVNEGFLNLIKQKKDPKNMFPVLNCVKKISSYVNNKYL